MSERGIKFPWPASWDCSGVGIEPGRFGLVVVQEKFRAQVWQEKAMLIRYCGDVVKPDTVGEYRLDAACLSGRKRATIYFLRSDAGVHAVMTLHFNQLRPATDAEASAHLLRWEDA